MMPDRLLLDTSFIQALLNPRDQLHERARGFFPRVRKAAEVWLTEAVLVEVGNAPSAIDRRRAARFIYDCYQTGNMRIVSVDSDLFKEALDLYRLRLDKTWGLTDCISFVVMQRYGLTEAVTADQDFVQAGFRALLREAK